MSGATPQQFFAALFPGQQYSDDRASELAARLRAVADELQAGGAQQQQAAAQAAAAAANGVEQEAGEEQPSKRRRKDKQGVQGMQAPTTCNVIAAKPIFFLERWLGRMKRVPWTQAGVKGQLTTCPDRHPQPALHPKGASELLVQALS